MNFCRCICAFASGSRFFLFLYAQQTTNHMKTLFATSLIILSFAVGWSFIQAHENGQLTARLAKANAEVRQIQISVQGKDQTLEDLQAKIQELVAILTNSTARMAKLEAQNAGFQQQLEAVAASQVTHTNMDAQAKKAAQDRAWWASYQAAVSQKLTSRAGWQGEENKRLAEEAKQQEIIRQQQFHERLQAQAVENERVKAQAAMRAADAAMQGALSPTPGIIMQQQQNNVQQNPYVYGGAYWGK